MALASAHVEIYDVASGKLLTDLKGGANYIQTFEYSPDGKRILVSNWFGSAKILDPATGVLVANLPANKNSTQGVFARYSPDGKRVLANDGGNTSKVYDAVTGTLLLDLKGHKQRVEFNNFSPDGKKCYTVSPRDSTMKIWDAISGKLLVDLKGKSSFTFSPIRFSPDGKKIIAYSRDSIARIWNPENGNLIAELKGHSKFIQNLSFSPDGKKILTHSLDSTAKIWNAESGTLLYEIKEPGSRIKFSFFSPNGSKIVLSTQESPNKKGTSKILNAETGNIISELTQQQWYLFTLQFTPDENKVITSLSDGTIKIWETATGKILADLKGLTGSVYGVSFSPDRKKIIAGSNDGTVKVWDAETRNLLLTLKEHTFRIQSAVFSPDGKKIVTVSMDHTAKVWDAETGQSLYTFISVNEDDYLILDKDNHFDGTEGGRKSLYFTCGTEVIELDQVKDQLWVPNLAERILNGETINAAKLSDLNICNLTPLVDTIEQSAMQYRFRITPRLGGLGATIVSINGIEVKRFTPQQLQQQKNYYILSVDKKELQKFFTTNKGNSIVVKSLTAKNSISSRSVSINEKGDEKTNALPNLYAIVVGVSDYKGEELDLKFAAKDAIDMASAIDLSAKKLLNTDGKEHVFIYKVHTSPGRDKFPEKNSIKQLFTEISTKAGTNDILLIFFAGHGVVEAEKNQFYFLTADASNATVSGALKNVGISTVEIAEWIKPQVMKAQKRILIFDACNSGQAIKEMLSFNQDGKTLMASRGDDKGKQAKAIAKLNEQSGMFIISASASNQKAYEMGKFNQGVLTYSLLKAIKEQPDILEDRQYLNISRWFNAAEKSVNELARETGARQQPQLVSTSNFNIGVVDDDVRNKIVLPFEKLLFTRSEFRNAELRLDNLKLRNLVDKRLSEISDNESGNLFLYNPDYDGVNVYSLNGDYSIKGNEAAVSVLIIKGGAEIVHRFEIKSDISKPEPIADTIVNKFVQWVQSKN